MLGVRLDAEMEAQLARLARRRGQNKSELVREAVQRFVRENDEAWRQECVRQSLVVANEPIDLFWEALGEAAWSGLDETH
jgi:predicted transcriptional regulator